MAVSRFRKVVVVTEILIDDPDIDISMMSPTDVIHEIEDGGFSGVHKIVSDKRIPAIQMAQELIKQGSDPGFFNLDKNGKRKEYLYQRCRGGGSHVAGLS